MKINQTGITRIVIELKSVVIKIPNFAYSWEHFLNGLLANIHERDVFNYSQRNELLCPIVFVSWGGWLLIMKRADVERHEKERTKDTIDNSIFYEKWISSGFGGDDKPDNYGYYENRLVKIDYA